MTNIDIEVPGASDTRLKKAIKNLAGIYIPTQFGAVAGTGRSAGERAANATAIGSMLTAAVADGALAYIDTVYEIASTPINAKAMNRLNLDSSPTGRIIQYTNDIPGIQIGGAWLRIGRLRVDYNAQQGSSGASITANGTGGANAFEFWQLTRSHIGLLQADQAARGIHIPQADANGSGQSQVFSNTIEDIEITRYSYRGMDLQSVGGSTGNVFGNVYLRGNGIGSRPNVNIPLVMINFNDECIFNQLNIEHCSPFAIASGDSVNASGLINLSSANIIINALHVEGIEPKADDKAIVYAQSASGCDIRGFGFSTSYFLSANGCTKFHLARLFGTDAHVRIDRIVEHAHTLTGAVMDLGYAASALTTSSLHIGRFIQRTNIGLLSNVLPTNDQKVLKEVNARPVPNWLRAGRVFGPRGNGNGTLNPIIGSRLYATPFQVDHPVSVDKLYVYCANLVASSEVRMAIYHDDGTNQPGAKIAEVSAVVSTAGTGSKNGTITSPPVLLPGRYWGVVIGYNTAAGALPGLVGINAAVANVANHDLGGADMSFMGSSASASGGVYADVTIADATAWGAYVFPSTFPTGTLHTNAVTPHVGMNALAVP